MIAVSITAAHKFKSDYWALDAENIIMASWSYYFYNYIEGVWCATFELFFKNPLSSPIFRMYFSTPAQNERLPTISKRIVAPMTPKIIPLMACWVKFE